MKRITYCVAWRILSSDQIYYGPPLPTYEHAKAWVEYLNDVHKGEHMHWIQEVN